MCDFVFYNYRFLSLDSRLKARQAFLPRTKEYKDITQTHKTTPKESSGQKFCEVGFLLLFPLLKETQENSNRFSLSSNNFSIGLQRL
jgi:hypothetical protein